MLDRLAIHVLKGFVRLYQLVLSPLIGKNCRFQPTCSAYAIEALEKYGTWRGSWLVLKRLGRCHPIEKLGGGSGYDPVPERDNENAK